MSALPYCVYTVVGERARFLNEDDAREWARVQSKRDDGLTHYVGEEKQTRTVLVAYRVGHVRTT